MRTAFLGLLVLIIGCQPSTPTEAVTPPTEEEVRGSDASRIDFVQLWKTSTGREVSLTERDSTEPPARTGWSIQRRIVAITTPGKTFEGPDERLGFKVYAEAIVAEIERLGGESPARSTRETPWTSPQILINYRFQGKRSGEIWVTMFHLNKNDGQVPSVLEFLRYQQGKEFAIARGNLGEQTGAALALYLKEGR